MSRTREQTAGNRPYQHLYGRKAWPRLRRAHLGKEPLCRMCKGEGIDKAAEVVDHVQPHKGDPTLFWNADNLQALCAAHHNSAKQRDEKLGFSLQIGQDGWPVDREHPANK